MRKMAQGEHVHVSPHNSPRADKRMGLAELFLFLFLSPLLLLLALLAFPNVCYATSPPTTPVPTWKPTIFPTAAPTVVYAQQPFRTKYLYLSKPYANASQVALDPNGASHCAATLPTQCRSGGGATPFSITSLTFAPPTTYTVAAAGYAKQTLTPLDDLFLVSFGDYGTVYWLSPNAPNTPVQLTGVSSPTWSAYSGGTFDNFAPSNDIVKYFTGFGPSRFCNDVITVNPPNCSQTVVWCQSQCSGCNPSPLCPKCCFQHPAFDATCGGFTNGTSDTTSFG